jgi:hypothetical protein
MLPMVLKQKLAFFAQTTAIFAKILRKTPIFRRKFSKIAENCDRNIDPSSPSKDMHDLA